MEPPRRRWSASQCLPAHPPRILASLHPRLVLSACLERRIKLPAGIGLFQLCGRDPVSSREIRRLMFVLIYSIFRCFAFPNSHFLKRASLVALLRGPRRKEYVREEGSSRERGVYISCLWEQLKTNLIVFGGLPWGLCRQEYGKAPTRDLASIINF